MTKKSDRPQSSPAEAYRLQDQIGFILRQVSQRHAGIFAELIGDGLTPTRFAALAKLFELGALSQNELGRRTAMDVATIKGVVDRLRDRDLVQIRPDPEDGRRHLVALTETGAALARRAFPRAFEITEKTLAPLDDEERQALTNLLRKLL